MASFEIKGRILDSLSETGISNCRIELWVQSASETFNLGLTATSVADGTYSLTGTVTNVPIRFTHFFLKIVQDTQTIKQTDPIAIELAKDKIYELDVYIDTVSVNGNMRVFGRVTDAFGNNIPNTTVKIYDKNFSIAAPPELGSCVTDNNGYYIIGYSYTNSVKSKPDIIVKVYDEKDVLIATSPLFLSADQNLEVNITPALEYKGTPEFSLVFSKIFIDAELFSSILNPALSISSRINKINSLTGQDIAYIANKVKVKYPVISEVLDIVYILCKINYYSEDNIHLLYALDASEDYEFQMLLSKKNSDLIAKIKQAVDSNIVKYFSSSAINTFVATLKTKLVDYLAGGTGTSLSQMFDTIELSDLNAKKAILETFLLQAESPDPSKFDYIAQLRTRIGNPATLTAAVVDSVESFLVILKFAGSIAIVDKLFKGGYASVNSFMSIDWDNLIELLDTNTEYFPSQYRSSIEYATAIFNNMDFEFPEKFFIKRALTETAFPNTTTKQFFILNPEFPLFSDYIEVLFEEPGIILTGFSPENIAQIKLDIQKLQSLSSISPSTDRYNTVKALWTMGITDVLSIDQYSKGEFLADFFNAYVPYTGIKDQETLSAEYAYNAAITMLFSTINTFAAYSNEVNSLNPKMINIYPELTTQQSQSSLPNFSQLFGGSNFCRCKTGRSILSPAAYFADLLNFKVTDTGMDSRVHELLTRRSDLKQLLLNEKNTFTQLPYIDIVNEVLGNAISSNSTVYNTTLDEQTISAIPEHLDSLSNAIDEVNEITNKAWKLPFHFWLAEYRAWCKQLTVPRYRLMELFPYGSTLTNHTLAAKSKEFLGLSTQQADKILYNDQDTLQSMNYYAGTTDYLKMIGNFLKASGMTLEELNQMLTSHYVNPDINSSAAIKRIAVSLRIDPSTNIQDCDLTQAEFKYIQNGVILDMTIPELEGFLKRIYRFAHLNQCLKLTVPELDLLINHEGYMEGQWDDNLLIALAEKIGLKNDLSFSVEDIILLYGEFGALNYENYTNLYDSLFTNGALKTLPDNLDTLALNDEKAKNLICGALQIHETDYYYLLKELHLFSNNAYQFATRSNLAQIYRTNRFCRLLKISFKDYFKLILVNNDVSPVKNSEHIPTAKQTKDFIELYTNLTKRGITVDEIYMLLSATLIRKVKSVHSITSPVNFCTNIGNKLFEQKQKLEAEFGVTQDFELYQVSYVEIIKGFLNSIKFNEADIIEVIEILDTTFTNQELKEAAQAFIISHFSSFCNQYKAAENLTTGTIETRYRYLLNEIIHFKLRHIVFNEFALEFGISDAQVNKMMTCWIETSSGIYDLKAIEFFINNDQIEEFNPESQAIKDFELRKEQLDKFTKAAWFIIKYNMSEIACDFIYNSFKNEADHKILNIFDLPYFDSEESEIVPLNEEISTRSTFVFEQVILLRWNNLDTAFRLDNSFSVTPRTIFNIWNTCTVEGFNQLNLLDELSRTTGWNINHITFLMNTIEVNLRFCTITWIKQLAERLFASSITGLIPQAIVDINLPDTGITNLQVQILRGAVKSKFTLSQWIKVAKGIMDPLRRELRDAFVSYILTNGLASETFDSVNAIYDYFLIDPLMEPCSRTSRIVQATLSIQLFIQRILLNLEKNVLEEPIEISEEAKEKWLWHKNFRIWEACRKIFLYPENWLEPDWRKNKSEFFTELNDYLIENDINTETAEKAFVDYLDKIEEVSDLEVVSLFHTYFDYLTIDTVYYLARTKSLPYKYYMRTYNTKMGCFSYWEKVSMDIDSNCVSIVFHEGRYIILWTKLLKDENKSIFQIHFHFAIKERNKWTKKAYILNESAEFSIMSFMKFNNSNNIQLLGSNPGYYHKFTIFEVTSNFEVKKYYTGDSYPDKLQNEVQYKNGKFFLQQNYLSLYSVFGTFKLLKNLDKEFSNTVCYSTLHKYKDIDPYSEGYCKLMPIVFGNKFSEWYAIPEVKISKNRIANLKIEFLLTDTQKSLIHENQIFQLSKEKFYNSTESNGIISNETIDWQIKNYNNLDEGNIEKIVYKFYPLKHFFSSNLKKTIRSGEIFKLFDYQNITGNSIKDYLNFSDDGQPLTQCNLAIDFNEQYPFGDYNWELFYHIPIMIATKLSTNQQFEEAQKWFHCVFDPTNSTTIWKFLPFQKFSDDTSDIREFLHNPYFASNFIEIWENDPLDAHAIVRNRTMAYMRYTVMKYLDNLIAWGDYLFAQDNLEALNEATQIYILASEILGSKPELVDVTLPNERSFEDISPLDSLGNSLFTLNSCITGTGGLEDMTAPKYGAKTRRIKPPILTAFKSLYFGIPYNEKLIGYWDLVTDRLFKLRNCMNLKGIVRDLPLFSPPIDPALLVQAGAAGLNLSQIVAGLNVSVGAYRYRTCLQRAKELTNEVIALGSSLLTALEKRDSEYLSLLKATHETTIQKAIRGIKEKTIEELQHSIESLEFNISNAEARFKFNKERNPLITNEKLHLSELQQANQYQLIAQGIMPLVSILGAIPQIAVGIGANVEFGGTQMKVAPQTTAEILNLIASIHQYQAQVAAIKAGYDRRQEEWIFQADQAETEIKSLQKQLLASKVRLAIVENELSNHDLQIEQSEEYYEVLKEKFTNKELYDWMVSDLSSIYFQSYRLANEYAKQSEQAYRFEINAPVDDTFISYGHWDNLKKGLMAGERLRAELNMLDKAYTDANTRKLEITKSFSLALFDPEALKELRIAGSCEFSIPEYTYDLDYPGHYLRRIKSAALSIPAVTAPNSSVACKLTLLENSYRHNTELLNGSYPEAESDLRFVYNPVNIQSIVTSSAQNDRGIFEFNFNDERYLPFEGAGAISRWRIELPAEFRQFDYNTISDVILSLNYTAEDSGETLKTPAIAAIKGYLAQTDSFKTSFNWKAVCPDSLYQLNSNQSANFRITKNQFPAFIIDFLDRGNPQVSLTILGMDIVVPGNYNGQTVYLKTLQETEIDRGTFSVANGFSGAALETQIAFDPNGMDFKLEFGSHVDDILMILSIKID